MSATSRRLAAALLLLLLPTAGRADSQGGSFRLWAHGARELAMGGAATLHAPGVEALFDQPASLVGLGGWQLGASLQQPTGGPELRLSSLAAGIGSGWRGASMTELTPSSRYAAALAFQHLGATLADDSGWGEWTLTGGAAWSPRRWLSVGLRWSYSRGGSDDGLDRGRAVSLSGGLRAVLLHPGLELGWVAEDMQHRFRWEDGTDDRRAPAQSFSLAARLPASLSVELLARWRFGAVERWAAGAEWRPWRRLHLRGGLVSHRQVESSLSPSFGFGLLHGGLRLDYGFRWERDEGPGHLHRLSLLWTGGRS